MSEASIRENTVFLFHFSMSNDVVSEAIFSAFKAFFTINGRDVLFDFSPGELFLGFGHSSGIWGGIIKISVYFKSFYSQTNLRKIPTSN